MPPILKPMLASPPGPGGIDASCFPLLCTPKIDGIRALVVGGHLVSRTLKPIQNATLRAALEGVLPEGADGEITHGETFQDSTSAVMTRDGPKTGFTYHLFDVVDGAPSRPYADRVARMRVIAALLPPSPVVDVVPLFPEVVADRGELDAFEERMLAAGYEGVIARSPRAPYKFGRSTPKECGMMKIKRFDDAEAVVTGAEELVHKDGARGGVLGALVVHAVDDADVVFRIGSGFSAAQRRDLWARRKTLVGLLAKYKFFSVGVKTAPRFPIFLGFRDESDL